MYAFSVMRIGKKDIGRELNIWFWQCAIKTLNSLITQKQQNKTKLNELLFVGSREVRTGLLSKIVLFYIFVVILCL